MAGYLGAIPVPQATQHRETFTATSGQTTFATAGYTVGFLDVYLNGSHLSPADFTATNGSDVVLASGASADDVCDIISYTAFEVADQTFTGTTTMDVAAITGVLTTTAATVFNGGFASNADSTMGTDKKLIFRDSAIHISSTADGDLSIAADDEIDITSTLIDINGAVDMSSTLATASTITVTTSASTKAGSFVGNGIEIKHPTGASNLSIGTQTGNDVKIAAIGAQAMRLDTNGSERMRLDSSGNILFNTTAVPSASSGGAAFDPNTNGRAILKLATTNTGNQGLAEFFNPNGQVGGIVTNGSATAYNTSSDYRLKTDAQPMTGASDRVLALKPVNFEWISDGTRVDGFLAHEAQEVVPEAVTGTKDAMRDEEYEVTPAVLDDDGNETKPAVMGTRSVPDMQGIDQSKMVPLLVAALQEALARITALENA